MAAVRRPTKSTDWCGTSYGKDLEWFKRQVAKCPNIVYWRCQNEVCPTTGRQHLQWFIQLDSVRALSFVRNIFDNSHAEVRLGSVQEADDYVNLEAPGPHFHKVGATISACGGLIAMKDKPGKRNDLEAFRDAILGGATDEVRHRPLFFSLDLWSRCAYLLNLLLLNSPTPANGA